MQQAFRSLPSRKRPDVGRLRLGSFVADRPKFNSRQRWKLNEISKVLYMRYARQREMAKLDSMYFKVLVVLTAVLFPGYILEDWDSASCHGISKKVL